MSQCTETVSAAALKSRAAYCDELSSVTVGGLREMHRTNAELFRRAAAALATQAKESVWERPRRETRHNPACPHCKRGYAIHGEYGGTTLISVYHITPDGTPVPHEVLSDESSAATQAPAQETACPGCDRMVGPHYASDCAGLATQAPPEPAGERAWLRENVLKVLLDKRQRTGLIVNMCGAPPGGVAHNVVTFILDAAERAAATPPQPLDGVTAALRVQLTACEASLAIFDEGHDSEYWLRVTEDSAPPKGNSDAES